VISAASCARQAAASFVEVRSFDVLSAVFCLLPAFFFVEFRDCVRVALLEVLTTALHLTHQAFNLSKDTLYSTCNQLAPHILYRLHEYVYRGACQVVHALEQNQSDFSLQVTNSGDFIRLPFVSPSAVRVELHGTINKRRGGAPQGFYMRIDVEKLGLSWQITAITVTEAPIPSYMAVGLSSAQSIASSFQLTGPR
jgi:hypothetical protein